MKARRTSNKETRLLAIFRRLRPSGQDNVLEWAGVVARVLSVSPRARKAARR